METQSLLWPGYSADPTDWLTFSNTSTALSRENSCQVITHSSFQCSFVCVINPILHWIVLVLIKNDFRPRVTNNTKIFSSEQCNAEHTFLNDIKDTHKWKKNRQKYQGEKHIHCGNGWYTAYLTRANGSGQKSISEGFQFLNNTLPWPHFTFCTIPQVHSDSPGRWVCH